MGKLFVYVLGIFLFFGSCEDNKKKVETENPIRPPVEVDTAHLKNEPGPEVNNSKENPFGKITNGNVVAFLTEFGKNNPETKVRINTPYGNIEIELFKDTPLHRANFIYLVKQKYFDDTFFYRVVPNFIVQAGNSDLVST